MSNEARLTLNLPAELLRLVDDYWHSERLSSRNHAIRVLLFQALEAWMRKSAKEQRR